MAIPSSFLVQTNGTARIHRDLAIGGTRPVAGESASTQTATLAWSARCPETL